MDRNISKSKIMNQDFPLNASIGHAENHSDFKFESAHFRKQMHQSMTHFHRNLEMTESQYLMEQLLNKLIEQVYFIARNSLLVTLWTYIGF